MSVSVAAARTLSVREATDAVASVMMTRRVKASEAVDLVLPMLVLEPDAERELIRQGLISVLNSRHHEETRQLIARGPRPSDRFRFPSEHVRQAWLTPLLIVQEGADGQPKSLLSFTADDATALEGRCIAQASGWTARVKAAKKMRKLLAEYGAETVAGLPTRAKRELAEKVAEAWS